MGATTLIYLLIHIIISCSSMLTKINSISLPLIPIDSPKLQILPDSLSTQRQLRLQFLKNISMARAASYTPRDSNTSINSIQSLVQKVLSGFYVTQLFFGSSSYLMSPYLLVDTGDTNTWVQVEGCNPCFEVKNGNIRPQASPTFALLSLDDPRCNPKLAYHWSCGYKSFYGSASSGGEMGTELFHFINAETQEPESYPCVAFGLGYQNQFFDFGLNTGPNNLISGVFGLSPGPRSLINQLDETIKGRFSYCLTDWDEQNPGMSTINFGDSARITAPDVIQMPMNARLRYHLFFRGMSVDGTRVPFHSSNCALQDRPVTGGLWKGFFIDSGSPYSVLPPAAYQPLRAAMISYFARYGLQPLAPGGGPFDLCYSKGLSGGQTFPSVVFHFAGLGIGAREVDWVMTNDNMFLRYSSDHDGFCMAMGQVPDPGPCIFGAFQQINFKILYDLSNWVLSFAPQQCQENRPSLYHHLPQLLVP